MSQQIIVDHDGSRYMRHQVMLSCCVIFICQVCEDMLKRAKTFALLAAFKQPCPAW